MKIRLLSLILPAFFCAGSVFGFDVVSDIIEPAVRLIGTPYRYQGNSEAGFDCSGFVYYLYHRHVPSLPRSSKPMSRTGTARTLEQAEIGDLMFFETMGAGTGIAHVGIYIGDLKVIHAISNGPETGVLISRIDTGYWKRTFRSIRHVLPRSTAAAGVEREKAAEITATVPVKAEKTAEWESFDGQVYGDYAEWKQQDENAFEAFKRREQEELEKRK